MFENRLFFVDKLVAMGARITLCDPHRAIVSGPSRLHGERVESPDIRAGMAMLIAALAPTGTSEIGNIVQIDRGYERIDLRLRELGARIERVAGRARPRLETASSMTHPIPPGTRDILPDEMRELRRLEAALIDVFERSRLRRGLDADDRVPRGARARRRARRARPPTGSSTRAASCWRCAPT